MRSASHLLVKRLQGSGVNMDNYFTVLVAGNDGLREFFVPRQGSNGVQDGCMHARSPLTASPCRFYGRSRKQRLTGVSKASLSKDYVRFPAPTGYWRDQELSEVILDRPVKSGVGNVVISPGFAVKTTARTAPTPLHGRPAFLV